jgi:hypothetical protein
LGWGFAKKALTRAVQVFRRRKFHITSRSSTSRFAPWTAFKSQFYGFAAQKYSIKLQLKICRLARRYVLLKVLFCAILKVRKSKTG